MVGGILTLVVTELLAWVGKKFRRQQAQGEQNYEQVGARPLNPLNKQGYGRLSSQAPRP
jgi:hypothetical protein